MNNSYVLLRNNVESSSLSFGELQQVGLLETDLVWVECQSVCWQNPREIPELRKLMQAASQEQKITTQKKSAEQNSVHVELPDGNTFVKKHKVEKNADDAVLINMNKYGNPGKSLSSVADRKTVNTAFKYDALTDEIPESFPIRQTQKTNTAKSVFGFALPEKIKKITVYTGLVGLGALLMFFIMKNDRNKVIVQSVPQQAEKDVAVNTSSSETPEELNTPVENSYQEPVMLPVEETGNKKNQKTPSLSKSNTSTDATNNEALVPEEDTEKKEVMTPAETKPKPVKKITPENIRSKLAVSANEYTVGSFGGIKNLEVTLQNSSDYILDNISVTINYLNPEGRTVMSDKINFQSVAPGGVVTLPVKKSRRGVKVDLAVAKIESKEITAINTGNNDSLNYSKN